MKLIDFLGDKDSPESNWGKKVTCDEWNGEYVSFHFKDQFGVVYGLDGVGDANESYYESTDEDWHLYEAKPEPVRKYLYAYQDCHKWQVDFITPDEIVNSDFTWIKCEPEIYIECPS